MHEHIHFSQNTNNQPVFIILIDESGFCVHDLKSKVVHIYTIKSNTQDLICKFYIPPIIYNYIIKIFLVLEMYMLIFIRVHLINEVCELQLKYYTYSNRIYYIN